MYGKTKIGQAAKTSSSVVLNLEKIGVVFPGNLGSGDVVALRNVNLAMHDREFIVALGASGCGKTTLLNVMAGFIKPTSGRIRIKGKEVEGPSKERGVVFEDVWGPGKDRGVVFQKHALLPWLNVLQNTAFGLKLQGVSERARLKVAKANLDLVGLKDFGTHPVFQLSGGMQQRVGLARALTSNPEILLMDEPLGALDAFTRETMQELILDVWHKTHKAVFFITHSVEEALFMATRLIVMSPRPGRITHEYELSFWKDFLDNQGFRIVDVVVDIDHMQRNTAAVACCCRRRSVQGNIDILRGERGDHICARVKLDQIDAFAAQSVFPDILHLRLPRADDELIPEFDIGCAGVERKECARDADSNRFQDMLHNMTSVLRNNENKTKSQNKKASPCSLH